MKIDDPLDAFAVHAGGGGWGLISTCIISHDGIAYGIGDAIGGKGGHRVGQTFAVGRKFENFSLVISITRKISDQLSLAFWSILPAP